MRGGHVTCVAVTLAASPVCKLQEQLHERLLHGMQGVTCVQLVQSHHWLRTSGSLSLLNDLTASRSSALDHPSPSSHPLPPGCAHFPPGLQLPSPHPHSSNRHRRAACASGGGGSGGNSNHTAQPAAPAAIVAASTPPPPPSVLPSSHVRPPSRPASASAVPAVASSPRAMAHQPQGTSTPASEPQHRHSAAGSTHGQHQGQHQGQPLGQLQGQLQGQHAWAGTAAEESRCSPSAEPTQAQPHGRQAPGASASASGSHAASSARAQLYSRAASAKARASHSTGNTQDQVPGQHVVPESAAVCLRRPSSSPGVGYAQDGMQGQVVGRDAAGGSGKPPRALPGGGAGVGSWAVEGDRRSNGWAAGASGATRRDEESRGSGQGGDRAGAGRFTGSGGGGGEGGGGGGDVKERTSLSRGAWQPGGQRAGGGAGPLAEGDQRAQAGGTRSGKHSGSVLAQRDVSGPGGVPGVDPARQRQGGSGALIATAGGRYGGGAPSSSGSSAVGGGSGRAGGGGGSGSSSQRLVGAADAAYDAAVSISVTAGLRRRRRYRCDLKDESLNPHVMATRLIKAGLTPKVRASKPCF